MRRSWRKRWAPTKTHIRTSAGCPRRFGAQCGSSSIPDCTRKVGPQAVEYFRENSANAEGQIRAEVRRYIVTPGQATAYKVGMLKILELRSKAQAALGDEFDIRAFHDTVLGGGALPLSLLERRVDQWIAAQQRL